MPIRVRKLIGALALLVRIVVWTILAMALAYAVFRLENPFLAAVYYVVAGIGWVLPAMPLVSWMLRPDPEPGLGGADLRRVTATEAVPHGGRCPRHQHAHITALLKLAIDRDARKGRHMVAGLGEQHGGSGAH